MSDRYSQLFINPANLYTNGSPVIIMAQALLKDNQTGRILAQIKFKNVGRKLIKALKIGLYQQDPMGRSIGAKVEYEYLDLKAGTDEDFGQKQPVFLPDITTRSYYIDIDEIIYDDNTSVSLKGMHWEDISDFVSLSPFVDDELLKQFKIEVNPEAKYLFKKTDGLWMCSCGTINIASDRICHICGADRSIQEKANLSKISEDKDERLKKERFEAEEKGKKKAVERKKIAIITSIVAMIVVAVSLTGVYVIKPTIKYNTANRLMREDEYGKAKVIFKELDNYKNSKGLVKECDNAISYSKADKALRAGDYVYAISKWTEISDYKDSKKD